MRLLRYKVTEFRSIHDSGWIDLERITGLIGTNESGKTNLLLPLHFLNSSDGREQIPLDDMPRARYAEFRDLEEQPIFVHAEFELSEEERQEIDVLSLGQLEQLKSVTICKDYESRCFVGYPDDCISHNFLMAHAALLESERLLTEEFEE